MPTVVKDAPLCQHTTALDFLLTNVARDEDHDQVPRPQLTKAPTLEPMNMGLGVSREYVEATL